MAECAYCGHRSAEVRDTYQTIVILDSADPGSWQKAEELMTEWQEQGFLEREAIVDRRVGKEEYVGSDRRMRPSWVASPLAKI